MPDAGQDTATVRFSDEDEYSRARSAAIPAELEGIRQIRFNRLQLPVQLTVACSEGQICGYAAPEVVSAAKLLIRGDVLDFRAGGLVAVEIGTERTQVRVGVVYKVQFSTEMLFGRRPLQSFAANVVTAVGLALGRLRQTHAAAALILSSAQYGDLLETFTCGIEAAFYLADDNRAEEALALAASSTSSRDSVALLRTMALAPLLARPTQRSYDTYTQVLRSIVVITERRGDMSLWATARYNLASHLRSGGRWREALHYYHLALNADRRYAERGYIWRELGGLFFLSGHFRSAVACYERAIARGDTECAAQLADALLWAGEYERAIAEFESYLSTAEYPPSEWVLKAAFVRMVRHNVGSGTQHRQRLRAMQLAAPSDGIFQERQADAAFQEDGLCGLAWFNQAFLEVQAARHENAAKCYIAAALCQLNDLQAWCAAVGSAINAGRFDLLAHIISAAYSANGELFSAALFDFVRQQPDEFPKLKVIELFGEIIAAVPVIRQFHVIRLLPRSSNTT